MRFKVEGINETINDLENMELSFRQKKAVLVKAMRASAQPMLKQARTDVPKGPTGNLRKGIKVRSAKIRNPKNTIAAAQIGNFAPHAHWISYGTGPRTRTSDGKYLGMVAPNFYFERAYEGNKMKFINNMNKEVLKQMQKAADKHVNGK